MARRAVKREQDKKERPIVRVLVYFSLILVLALVVIEGYLYSTGAISTSDLTDYSSISTSFIFSTAVFSYLIAKGRTFKGIIEEVGLSRNKLTLNAAVAGFTIFFLIFLIEIAASLISALTGVQLPTNVQQVLQQMPLYFLIFTVFIAPLNEEIFFRGFLVSRFGIILPSALFAFLHWDYNSITELLAAFIFALLASYAFKKTKSLYPSLVAHILVNGFAVAAFIFASQWV